jgi:hypothetical protein
MSGVLFRQLLPALSLDAEHIKAEDLVDSLITVSALHKADRK